MEERTALLIPSSKLHTAEALVPQVEHSTQTSQDFVVQLRTICDSVLYAYLSKVANTAEKRHFLHASCTAVAAKHPTFRTVDTFIDFLDKSKIFDRDHSIFQPYNLNVFLAIMSRSTALVMYFRKFTSDPERSREFHYEDRGLWHAFIATRYMRFMRTLSDSR